MSSRQRSLIPQLFNIPFSRFPSLLEELENDISQAPQHHDWGMSSDNNNIYIHADLPGLKPEDINITLENGIIFIRGEQKEKIENKDLKVYKESSRSFSYRLTLPDNVDEKTEPEAVYKDGVIQIKLKKAVQNQAKKISVRGG